MQNHVLLERVITTLDCIQYILRARILGNGFVPSVDKPIPGPILIQSRYLCKSECIKRHQVETFSAFLALSEGNPKVTCGSLTKTSDAELWYFLWCAPEQTVEQTICRWSETPWCPCDVTITHIKPSVDGGVMFLVIRLTSHYPGPIGFGTLPWERVKGIVPFHKYFSPSGEQLEHRKLAHKL